MAQADDLVRREFLLALGLAAADAGLLSSSSQAADTEPPAGLSDAPRDLPATGADLGSLFPDLENLAQTNRYTYSFLGGRFRNLDEFKTTARAKVFDLLLYRPDKVD